MAVIEWDAEKAGSYPPGVVLRIAAGPRKPKPGRTLLQRLGDALHGHDEASWTGAFSELLDHPIAAQTPGIVTGIWGHDGSMGRVVKALADARERLPNLKALFIGDIIFEECELSWIEQTDQSPIFAAYPGLEHFGVRGGNNLTLGTPTLPSLRTLIVETGGMDARIAHEIARASLPALEHLELWFGEENYGANVTVKDLEPILSGRLFPNLKYLGLCDSEIADDIGLAVANSPILERIETLDLSMGTLGDRGAEALLASSALHRLKKLDIHHHFCSEEVVARLESLDIEVDAEDRQEEEDGWRYVAVGE